MTTTDCLNDSLHPTVTIKKTAVSQDLHFLTNSSIFRHIRYISKQNFIKDEISDVAALPLINLSDLCSVNLAKLILKNENH